MKESTIDKSGRTTVPVQVRRKLGLAPGIRLYWTVLPDRTIRVRIKKLSVQDIVMKVPAGTYVSIEDMSR